MAETMPLAPNHFLHGSRAALAIGTRLTPGHNGFQGVDGDIESLLEETRPSTMPARDAVIYMARDLRTLENVCRAGDHVYEVTPAGPVFRLDGAWINQIFSILARYDDDPPPLMLERARRCATSYWTGRLLPDRRPLTETIWEYMTPAALVVRDLTPALRPAACGADPGPA